MFLLLHERTTQPQRLVHIHGCCNSTTHRSHGSIPLRMAKVPPSCAIQSIQDMIDVSRFAAFQPDVSKIRFKTGYSSYARTVFFLLLPLISWHLRQHAVSCPDPVKHGTEHL